MSIWFVHRNLANNIAWAGQYQQPGYADEPLNDTQSQELQTFLASAVTPNQGDSTNLPKILKAILLTAGQMAGKTPAQTAAAFTAVWQALP